MTLQNLFKIPGKMSSQQKNWLKMVASIPGAKQTFGDDVLPEDEVIANEAKDILEKHD